MRHGERQRGSPVFVFALGVLMLAVAVAVSPGSAAERTAYHGQRQQHRTKDVPPQEVRLETGGQEAALFPEEADGLTNRQQEAGQKTDMAPLIVPRFVPDPALVASEKAQAGGRLPPEETASEDADELVS